LIMRISSESGHDFLMEFCWAPVFHPEICDQESLFLFLYLSSTPYFENLINSEPFTLFHRGYGKSCPRVYLLLWC
jgi:hypothetical protein